jgi:7-carboxy-7-deazaguanine synthase
MLFSPLAPLADRLRSLGKIITVETAGTVHREVACNLMSISPKLASSAPSGSWRERHERTRLDRRPLQRLIDDYEYQLKFVVTESLEEDLEEIDGLLSGLTGIEPNRVFLMPEGRDSEVLRRRAAMLVEPCLKRNWRLTMRMQIDLFGDTRGT